MKQKTSISHDEALVGELRESPDFAAEYLRAALKDQDEPRVLLVALRRVAEARGRYCRSGQGCGRRAREPLPSTVDPRQSSPVHPGCRNQGVGFETYS